MKFSVALLAASVFGDSATGKVPQEARLLVSKKTEAKVLAQNQDITFAYKIYNIGSEAALNVRLTIFEFRTLF